MKDSHMATSFCVNHCHQNPEKMREKMKPEREIAAQRLSKASLYQSIFWGFYLIFIAFHNNTLFLF